MPYATVNGIRIAYETFGNRSLPTLLLISGCGSPLFFWDDDFCRLFVRQGYGVVRFDNRDSGLSTKFASAGVPDMAALTRTALAGGRVECAYTLEDMADDAVGLLDVLGIGKAHVCGASMGGMIAQVVACRHPGHVLSLVSIMSCTGDPAAPRGRKEAIAAVCVPPPNDRAGYVAHNMAVWRKIWSPGFPFERERARAYLERSYDRCYCPEGAARQNAALLANGDRRPALAKLRVPALVIHGAEDPLIAVGAGRETAESIPGARLLVIPGMGHDMPRGVWERMADAIVRNAERAAA